MALITRTKTWSTGEVLTASDLNAEFDGIVDNLDPTGIDDESADAAAQRATKDPYDSATRVPSESLEHELQTLRYQIKQLAGTTYWYEDPLGYIWIPAIEMMAETVAGADGTALTDDGAELVSARFDSGDEDIIICHWEFQKFDTTAERTYANIVFPSNWDLGTVKAKFYWSGQLGCATTDHVEWTIQMTALNEGDTMNVAKGTGIDLDDLPSTADGVDMQISPATAAITVGGTPAAGVLVNVSISRTEPASNDMDEDASLYGVMIQYKKGAGVAAW